MRERNGQRFKGLCVRVSAGLFAERKVKQSALECTNIVLAGWLTAMSALRLPKNKCESCEREEACRQHTSKAVALVTAARYLCGPQRECYKKNHTGFFTSKWAELNHYTT